MVGASVLHTSRGMLESTIIVCAQACILLLIIHALRAPVSGPLRITSMLVCVHNKDKRNGRP